MTDKHGYYFLHELALLSSDRGSDVVRKLVKYYEETQWRMSWLIKAVPFMLPAVYTVVLAPVPIEDISRDIPCVVDVDAASSRCHVLTRAVRDTGSLPDTADFVLSYRRFAVVYEAPGKVHIRDALLVRLELNKLILLVFVATSIILSIGFGVLAGIYRESLETGLGVFGAILGVIGIVEGLLTWLMK
ncbi:hypothetical protein B0J13DRAFT_680667 [Dactylonectria estremocensis]|uniref:Uncharacterized protein n=1 Tax=Dactylonectria estremocensis TaxID=1079267 RepID=A0A9P9DGX6_9HYPO|nr:hypothetical protein B0J13DRAFT_680667 [Dactylonectria estremocensis]